jgi:starch-binding outer membrane protein, SusD/RagB family
MIKNKYIYLTVVAVIVAGTACKKQLNVGNPNQPTLAGNVTTEAGLVSFAQGTIFTDGFVNGDGWLGDTYFSLVYGFQDLMGDLTGADVANQQVDVISRPDLITTETNFQVSNPSPQIGSLRSFNTRASSGAGNNPFYYQWLNMYALNNACNVILTIVPNIKFSGDAASRAATVNAWCYWWKGYAYAAIGTMYYAGLINDTANVSNSDITNNHYLIHDSIIARSDYYFNLASSTISGISSASDFTTIMSELIPSAFQGGNLGGVPTQAQWIRNINTMLARNILLNHLNPFVNGVVSSSIQKSTITPMTTADWQSVLSYTATGIQQGDPVFTGSSSSTNTVFTATTGSVSAMTTGPNSNTTFKISERLIEDFNTGDKRLPNNFSMVDTFYDPNFTTRWNLENGGSGDTAYSHTIILGNKTPGAYQVYIASSWEENTLMLAEANIMTGNITGGLLSVDSVRTYQGAGLTASSTSLTQAQALTQLTRERRVALVFRGLSWYDARRWGWTYATSNGGGSYGNTYLDVNGNKYINTTINYDFLDYWDVPADESVLNPPGSGSAATINPNF